MPWVIEKNGHDEVFDEADRPRPCDRSLVSLLRDFTPAELARRERLQKLSLMNQASRSRDLSVRLRAVPVQLRP